MPLLGNKVALITGAGRGIGTAVARLMSDEGARVVVHYNSSREPAHKLAESLPGEAIALQADLTDQESTEQMIARAMEHFGGIDVLVNNAASFRPDVKFIDDNWEAYLAEFNGVMGTTFHPCKAVVPHMIQRGGGRIINFTATLIHRPAAGYGAHSTAKGAVLAFTRTLSRELGPHNITVNVVSPGMTMTDYSSSLPEAGRERVAERTPLRRLAEPIDVARVAVFYASDLAGFVTGMVISPDGGLATIG